MLVPIFVFNMWYLWRTSIQINGQGRSDQINGPGKNLFGSTSGGWRDATTGSSMHLHLCTTREPKVPSHHGNTTFRIAYTCTGPEYDDFGRKLQKLVASRHNHSQWGRMAFPFPANTTILIMGNSHMAQVVNELICQYSSVLETFRRIETGYYGWYSESVFINGARVLHASNSPLVYSHQWPAKLHDELGISLGDTSLLIIGRFHSYKPTILKTSFGQAMLQNASSPDMNFRSIPPPQLLDVLDAYKGPVIAVSMFASYAAKEAREYEKTISDNMERSKNVRIVDGRKYVRALGECGCPKSRNASAGWCDNSTPDNNFHRCTGVHGGHPDLIAWDVIEAAHELLQE